MPLFTETEAQYFFRGAPCTGAITSFRNWADSLIKSRAALVEGNPKFDELRSNAHREVERLLVLAASHYRRAYDALSSIGTSWTMVTLYYGCFFSASAIVGALGAWKLRSDYVLEVSHSAAGAQRFQVVSRPCSYRGSHEKFWDFYFAHAVNLVPSAASTEIFALQPVSSDVTWLTDRRNEVNYDSSKAIDLSILHKQRFSVSGFPASLPGNLNVMFQFCEAALQVANRICKSVEINSDALNALSIATSRSARVRELVIKERKPALGRKVKRRIVCG